MCVIAVVKSSVRLSKSDAEKMWEINSHGAGFAIYEGGEWKIEKGFMQWPLLEKRLKQLGLLDTEEHPPFVIHFRLVSVGSKTPQLTHPFPVELREGRGFLFHNGTLDIKRGVSSGMYVPEGESDTSQFAKLLSELRLSKEQLKLLVKEGGLIDPLRSGSRLAFCLPGEEEPLLIGEWHKHKELLVSNENWVARYRSWWDYGYSCEYGAAVGKRVVKTEEGLYFLVEAGGFARLVLETEAMKSLRVGDELLSGEIFIAEDGEVEAFLYTDEEVFEILGSQKDPDIVYVPSSGTYYKRSKNSSNNLALGKKEGKKVYYLARVGRVNRWKFFGELG